MNRELLWASTALVAWGVGLLLVWHVLPRVAHVLVLLCEACAVSAQAAARALVRALPRQAITAAAVLALLGGPRA